MKKLLFTLLLIVVFNLSTSAQYEFGTYYIDGNINYDLSNVKMDNVTETSTKNSNLTFTPEVGYFINNNLAIGIGVSYINNFDSNTNMTFSSYVNGNLDYKMYPSYSVGLNEIAPLVFIKYFYQPTNKLSISLRASYSLGWGTYTLIQKYTKEPQGQETIFKSEKNKIESRYIFLSPELQYLVTSKVGLQINFNGLGYISTTKYDNYFVFNGFNPSLSSGSITKQSYESTSFNIKPTAWSFGVFVLLN